ncbi:MAG: site-specific DNA-methyltransferase [Calditrichaeota bacterium]|nr:site-specific DNA-methyltransferase [Calditrichota bacterium]
MIEYKKIHLPLSSPLNPEEKSYLQEINRNFKPKEMKVEFSGEGITIFLREIDLNKLHQLEQDVRARYQLDEQKNWLKKIIQRIERIGSYGIHAGRRNFVDYNKERKVKNRAKKEEQRSQYFYARGHQFSGKNNDFPEEFTDRIICGDSEKVLAQLPDNCVDLIFTSPPYNFGLDYEQSQDDHFWENYFDTLFRIFDQCIRVLKFGGRIVVNIQPLFSDYIPSHHIISNFFLNKKLIWKGEILWEKNNYNCKYTSWGSWKSPSSPYLKYTWEFLEIFSKGDLKKSGDKENIDITADDFKKWVVAKWSISPERKMKSYGHPAMFPEELVKRVLQLFSYKNDVILDPFNGVGTTTYVAFSFARRYLGIDISEEYCRKAEQRIAAKLL